MKTESRYSSQGVLSTHRELDPVLHLSDQRAYRRFVRPGRMTGKIHKKSWAKIDPAVAKSKAKSRVRIYGEINNRLGMLDES